MNATTDIKAALVVSLRARRGEPAGFTWGDFMEAMARMGVLATDDLASVEYGIAAAGNGMLYLDQDDHGRFEVRERHS